MNVYPLVSSTDALSTVLKSLENSLTVALIASWELKECTPEEITPGLFLEERFHNISHIPVRAEGKIIGVLDRGELNEETSRGEKRIIPLTDGIIISESTGILTYIGLASESSYHLVVRRNAIEGIVTPSDLLKLPVRVVLFALLTHLESAMARTIRKLCPGESWKIDLKPKRLADVQKRFEEGKGKDLYDVDLLTYTEWCDKREICARKLPIEVLGSKTKFRSDLLKLETLRNNIVHANTYLTQPRQLRELVEKANQWVQLLEEFRSSLSAANTSAPS